MPDAESDQVFPYTWLRDTDPQLIHSHTRQKLHSSIDVPLDVKPLDAKLSDGGNEIIIKWTEEASGSRWPASSTFPIDFLRRQASPRQLRAFHHDISPKPWNRDIIENAKDLFVQYDSVMHSDAGLLRAASQLTTYGLLFVSGLPSKETSEEKAELPRLAQRFGHIRETFYGRTWDVMSMGAASRNIAYTDLDLGLHIDLEYFENPPRYQILHMLRNRGVIGGESIFSDAFYAAHALKQADREAFDTLCTEPVAFHYINDHHHLYREHPTIQLAPPGSYDPKTEEPSIQYINYSPPFQAPLPLRTARNPKFLPALKQFATYLGSSEALYEHRMEEGTAVIFDNRRVLHGRREFSNASKGEWKGVDDVPEGTRWLKGCYLEAEGILDQLSTLRDREVNRSSE